MIVAVWKKNQETEESWLFQFPENLESFTTKYDTIQEQLEVIAGLDDLLSGIVNLHHSNNYDNYSLKACTTLSIGMLSKSLGQILRVSASLHVLTHYFSKDHSMEPLPQTILESTIKASMDFVDVC